MFFVLFFTLVSSFSEDYSRWMSFIHDDLPITDVMIPGTHESSMYVNFPTNPHFLTQILTIPDQLHAGVRYFEMTLCIDTDNKTLLVVYNGYIAESTFDVYQSYFIDFLKTNPSETILLRVNYDQSSNAKKNLGPFDVLFEEVVDHQYYYVNDSIPTLNNIRGYIFLFKNFTSNISYYDYQKLYRYDDDEAISTNVQIMTSLAETHMLNYKGYNISLTITSASPNRSCCDQVYVANIINPNISFFLPNYYDFGIIGFDYITADYSYDVFTRNNLRITNELEASISYILVVVCIILFCVRPGNNMLGHVFVISMLNTSTHIFAMYYFYNMANYRDFNTYLSSTYILLLQYAVVCIMYAFNICMLLSRWLAGNLEVYSVELLPFRKYIIFTMLFGCTHLVHIQWVRYPHELKISQVYKLLYKGYLVSFILMTCVDFAIMFMFDVSLVISWLSLTLVLLNITCLVFNLQGRYEYMQTVQDFGLIN